VLKVMPKVVEVAPGRRRLCWGAGGCEEVLEVMLGHWRLYCGAASSALCA